MKMYTSGALCIRYHKTPELASAGGQAAMQKLLVEHNLLDEQFPGQPLDWHAQPLTDGLACVKVVVAKMSHLHLTETLNNLQLLGQDTRLRALLPNHWQLVVVEEPALTKQPTLLKAWVEKKTGEPIAGWGKFPVAGSMLPGQSRDTLNPQKTLSNIQQQLASEAQEPSVPEVAMAKFASRPDVCRDPSLRMSRIARSLLRRA